MLLCDHHLLNIKDTEIMSLEGLLLLVDKWNEIDVGLIVVAELECKVDVPCLLLFLEVNQLLEGHFLGVFLKNFGVSVSSKVIFGDDGDLSIHSNQRLEVFDT